MCTRTLFIVVIFVCVLGCSKADDFMDDVQQQCIQQCPLQNRTDDVQFDCGYDCKIDQCAQGCRLWNRALETSCKTVCNASDLIMLKELYCVMGCNDAMTHYFTLLRERIGTPAAPALVADSLTATSLSLKWEFPRSGAHYAGVRYLVQWRYEELSAEWQYCRNQTWGSQDVVVVDNLQPYTKYRFRVALLLSHHHGDPIVSKPSVVISTLSSGIPASAPAIVRAVPVDWSRISVSWEPGPFPHGPILSYVLHISENHPLGYSALKDIPATGNNFYTFQNLAPSRNYTLTVAMRNGVGEGPAATVLICTPEKPEVVDTGKPILILAGDHTVIQQGEDLLDEPIVIYKTREFIKGLAIHIRKQLLFISDSSGYIYKTHLEPYSNRSIILTPQNLKFQPLDLSIDWLNEQLYILGEVAHSLKSKVWQITRCNLDGSGLTVAVAGLLTKPHHIEVDPYNGYLFWVIDGSSRAGLYRLDLADISNGVKHEVRPDIILERPHLGAFTVDHTKFHLLVPDHNNNTVYAVSFDGREIHDVRNNTQQPMFLNVVSISTANGLFYWTNGNQVLKEEHYQKHNSYFHNAYPALTGQSYTTVVVNLPSSQPIPVPVNPPTAVQAILGSTLAKTSWQVPHLLGEQGKGAWQNWSYEINIKDITNSKTFSHKGINTTSYTIRNLEENTEYVIKTAAYTCSGTGPWSSEFRGRTLRQPVDDKYPAIIWSASEGVLTSDVTGENVQSLIQKSDMKDYIITDIAWYQNQLYLVSNTSQMYWYNISSHDSGKFADIDSIGSVAVDWIGKKLYWSNPKQQLIIRGNLNGTQQEPLPILTVAKELNIDSINAYIYWSTGHAVECARLNGVDRLVYHPAQFFSGKQVMGLTLDMEKEMVYWIVRSYEGSTLFRKQMAQHLPAGISTDPIRVSNLQKPNMQGPLCYFSDRLLWLQDDKNAVIGDINGQNTAVISGMSLSGLTMVSILDPQIQEWPDDKYKTVNVLPEAVSVDSIKIVGKWDSFNITWSPTNNTDFGKLFYEVKVNDGSKKNSAKITTHPYIKYWTPVPPYTKLDVAIRAYTYWGSAPQIRTTLFSPASTPSAPKNTRCYVTYRRRPFLNNDIIIIFRWDTPDHANGVIDGYIVKCWYKEEIDSNFICNNTVNARHLQYVAKNLTLNETYYFQVQAFTNIGNGDISDVLECNTGEEQPVPELLVSSPDSIYIQDFDTHKNYTIVANTIQPIDIAYLFNENKIFWLNELQEIYMCKINGRDRTKLISITGRGTSISLDWVERCLYYVQSETIGSSIYKLDLNKFDKGIIKSEFVLDIPHTIVSFEVSPFTRKFYWIEINQNQKNVLMQANIDNNKNVEIFFGRNRMSYKRANNNEYLPCNCPDHELIDKNFAIDHSDSSDRPEIVFIDSNTREIIAADMHGCICTPVVDKSLVGDSYTIYPLAADKSHIYWSNGTNEMVYYVSRNDNTVLYEKMAEINFIARGSQMQPFPVAKCLTPKVTPYQVTFNTKTADSITLNMPDVMKNDGCDDISLASIEFVIYYMPYNEEDALECDETCSKLTTFENTLKVTGLRPFSKYMFSIAIKNHYTDLQNVEEYISPGVVFQTAAGAPTKPQDVTATVLNPTVVEVKWLPPEELNGETVWYEIHSRTEVRSVRQKGEQRVSEENSSNSNEKYKVADLQKLFPNQTYLIWVRAYSENNETYTDSDSVQVQTYSEPNDIILINSTAYSIDVYWKISQNIERYTLQYTDVISNQWEDIVRDSTNETIVATIRDLKPKMKYRFRLSLKYVKYSEPYIWPSDTRFVFETLGDRPSPPGMPNIGHKTGDIYQVSWEASKDNGAPIEMYNLEGRGFRNYRMKRNTNRTAYSYIAPSIEEYEENEWMSYYNGTDTFWIITGLNPSYRYYFRVSALNIYGWSDPSKESNDFNLNAAATVAEKHEQMGLILGISVPLLATICVCAIVCFIYCVTVVRRKDKDKKSAQAMLANRPINPDVELATLRELPRRNNFIHNTNALYVSALPSAEELALLPQINRDQITLINFLGRGAFGEVYEGKAKKIGSNGADMKVAVKTLRKGATEQEKLEFLQEAQLMSHFKHEHILQLLGVCLDAHFIIMELMEGGDLLTYLRSNRKPQSPGDALTILDLLSMCVDVARGCRYLEEMHFVHRDLACRNCLVSSSDRQSRVVKIGDFGLARDIYKNDYYRKEGEGLLPVRWMAPESLVDGVFTCQSDVWAFGVLMWEIMTLGQQPYPARNNLEVLHYVKGGGRLEKPSHCPENLHKLMMDCWSYQPNNRPTFKYCLEILEELKNSTTDGPLTAVHSGNYISTIPNGSSWKTDNGDDANRDQVPLVQPTNYKTVSNGHVPNSQSSIDIPKYLEIICDGCDPPFNDGYEIPRSSIRSNKSVKLEDRARTFSTSSTISNGSVSSNKNVCGKNGVQKTIVSSLKDKLLPSVQSNGESCNHKENVRLDSNFDV